MLEVIVFVVATVGIFWLSRASLRVPSSHGFYRFFVFELLIVLFLLNWRTWFATPFAPHQIVSWLLLMVSLYLVIAGIILLRRQGKADDRRDETPLLGFEKTTVLVTVGLYRFIRHPLYSSLLFLGWGIFCKRPSWLGVAIALAATGFLVMTARVEEQENIRFFGEPYREYMKRTKMFVPYLL